jgi:hypothetical protein
MQKIHVLRRTTDAALGPDPGSRQVQPGASASLTAAPLPPRWRLLEDSDGPVAYFEVAAGDQVLEQAANHVT